MQRGFFVFLPEQADLLLIEGIIFLKLYFKRNNANSRTETIQLNIYDLKPN